MSLQGRQTISGNAVCCLESFSVSRAGNAPFMLHKDLLSEVVEEWYDISLR